MMASIYETIGGTYQRQGDYELPGLKLLSEEQFIGVWGQRYRRHLKQNHRILYYNLLTSETLNEHIAEVDRQAENMFQSLVKSLSEKENVTEKMKANVPMEWIQRMNNIRSRAAEIVYAEVIFI
ncbi:MAG: TnpV protein [[Ruminococcus] torques]